MFDPYIQSRGNMVKTQIKARGITDARVLAAMSKIPRHRFVEPDLVSQAYGDYPLSIGEGQTISQPYIVALMTEALELTGREKTLEIGTGSGYQTAILAELSAQVYTIERIPGLQEKAKKILDELGYTNIKYKVFDGTIGWPEEAPFDAVIVTAAAPQVPDPLLAQLAEDGRLVIPVGGRLEQDLLKITKKQGETVRTSLGGCRFVSLIGVHGWRD